MEYLHGTLFLKIDLYNVQRNMRHKIQRKIRFMDGLQLLRIIFNFIKELS